MRLPESTPWQSTGTTLGRGGQGEVQLVSKRNKPEGPKYALKILRNTGFRSGMRAVSQPGSRVTVTGTKGSRSSDGQGIAALPFVGDSDVIRRPWWA